MNAYNFDMIRLEKVYGYFWIDKPSRTPKISLLKRNTDLKHDQVGCSGKQHILRTSLANFSLTKKFFKQFFAK